MWYELLRKWSVCNGQVGVLGALHLSGPDGLGLIDFSVNKVTSNLSELLNAEYSKLDASPLDTERAIDEEFEVPRCHKVEVRWEKHRPVRT